MKEQREFERSKIPPLEILLDRIEGENGVYEQVKLIIEEVSEEGMRFWSSAAFEPGEQIQFNLTALEMDSQIQGRVAWIRSGGEDGYLCGFHIINE